MNQQIPNELILEKISSYMKSNPDKGFMEILYSLKILPILVNTLDLYFEPSNVTLERIIKNKI